jgi:hypothetical protein
VGFDLEFTSGKAVWVFTEKGRLEPASFVGTIIMLPFLQISFGDCYLLRQKKEETK